MKQAKVLTLIILFGAGFAYSAHSQNAGINTTGAIPSSNAVLDLNTGNSYNMGLIVPHVTLGASLTTFSPPIANAKTVKDTGMIVYNMNGAQPTGYYCWNGSAWVSVSGAAANAWLLTGNTGTTAGTNYIGTNDSMSFEIKVNGKQRMLFNPNQSCISAGLGNLAKVTTGHNNDAWGNYALVNNTTGSYNSAVGGRTLYTNTSGWGNNAHGHEALYSNTTGHSNSAIGDSALYKNTTGSNNTAVGILASYSNIVASSTTTFGDYAGYNNVQSRCTFIGDSSGYNNTTGKNEALGYFAMGLNTTGTWNTAVGTQALRGNTTASGSTAVGHYAGYNTNADYAVFIGDSSGYSNTSGIRNTAVGYQSLGLNTTGYSNTAIGYTSLYHNITGGQNTAIGYQADYSGTGYGCTAAGYSAMGQTTTGSYNTVSGWNALYGNLTGSSNTAVGSYAGYNSAANQNVFIGDSAGYVNTSGNNNTALGYNANMGSGGLSNATAIGSGATVSSSNSMVFGNNSVTQLEFNGALMPYYGAAYNAGTTGQVLTSQGANTAPKWITPSGSGSGWSLTGNAGTSPGTNFLGTTDGQALEFKVNGQKAGWLDYSSTTANAFYGYEAGNSTTGDSNTANGYLSLYTNVTGNANAALGYGALYNQQYGGNENTATGADALYNNSGSTNTANGYKALYSNQYGAGNIGNGYEALYSNTSGSYNNANGYQALYNISSGSYNNAIGYQALYNNPSGNFNVAIGYQAFYNNSGNGDTDIAIGYKALYSNSSGMSNIAIGNLALYSNTSGAYNTATGVGALHNNTYGTENTAIGYQALYNNTTFGDYNFAGGFQAGFSNTTGQYNTAVGFQALYGNTTGSNNTAIGYNANVGANNLSNATAIGNGATVSSSNTMVFGNSSVTQHEFNGALMPYYGAAYNAGTSGQALVSQGAGVAPQWGAVSVAGGGTGSASFNPNALIFEGPTSTSPLTSSVNMTYNTNHKTLVLGTGTLQSQSAINVFGNINSYFQTLLQNTNSGVNASTDLVVQDDQDSTHYGDLGINSSTYSQAGYQVQSPGDVYFYSNKSNVDIGTVNAGANGIDSIKFTCGGLNKSNLIEVMNPAGITTQVHFAADTILIPIHTAAYTPKYVGEKWIYQHAGDTTECTCVSLTAGRKVDSVTLGSSIGWSSTLTGFASNGSPSYKYTLEHKICTVYVTISSNSNSTSLTFTLPFVPKNSDIQLIPQYISSGIQGNVGVLKYTAGSNVASCATNLAFYNGWGNSGTKGITGLVMSYEIQ